MHQFLFLLYSHSPYHPESVYNPVPVAVRSAWFLYCVYLICYFCNLTVHSLTTATFRCIYSLWRHWQHVAQKCVNALFSPLPETLRTCSVFCKCYTISAVSLHPQGFGKAGMCSTCMWNSSDMSKSCCIHQVMCFQRVFFLSQSLTVITTVFQFLFWSVFVFFNRSKVWQRLKCLPTRADHSNGERSWFCVFIRNIFILMGSDLVSVIGQ